MRSKRAAPPCAITARPTGRWAISSTASASMAGKASLARAKAVAARLRGWCKAAARHSIVRSARNEQRKRPMAFQTILVEQRQRVGLITLNRPEALNALNAALIAELNIALDAFEADAGIGCIVLTGSERAFAAGADIKEMSGRSFTEVMENDFLAALGADRPLPQAHHRGGRGLRAGRRLRDRHDVRLHHSRRKRQIRPARNQDRRHPRLGRHAAPARASSARPRRWICASPAA